MREISYREIQIIEAVARHKTFSGAAHELRITQSAISHAIANLENRFNFTLFTRQSKFVEPTKFAIPFLRQFECIKKTLFDAYDDIKDMTACNDKPIIIQTGFRASALWLTPTITSLLKEDLSFSFEIQIGLKECQNNLISGKVDIVLSSLILFANTDLIQSNLIGTYKDVFFVHSAHPLTKKSRLKNFDLIEFPLIGDPIVVGPHNEFFKIPGKWGRYNAQDKIFYPAIQSRSIKEIVSIVRETNAIGFLPEEIIIDQLKLDYIYLLKIDDHKEHINQIYIISKNNSKKNKKLLTLRDQLHLMSLDKKLIEYFNY